MNQPQITLNSHTQQYECSGDWSILSVGTIELPPSHATDQIIIVNGGKISHFDSAGALVLLQYIATITNQQAQWVDFNQYQQDLLTLVAQHRPSIEISLPPSPSPRLLEQIGQETLHKIQQVYGLIHLVGDLTNKLRRAFGEWRRFQPPNIIANIASTGLNAMPIVGLLSFLIGVVLAYQMGLQLETYGATNFIAYLSGMAVFREFGPLITAIIVAGRTSSAFTAQIGSMKINEEIDAIYTMGLSPTELLVLPKLIGLLFIFPLLVFWADFFGILGSMLMSKYMLNIGYGEFLIRLQDAVGFKQMALGLYKTPAFAILIALVGCFQGFRVEANADSVGTQTTRSVVQALFLIIITDAIYSIIYSKMNL